MVRVRLATYRMFDTQQYSEMPATLVGTSGNRIRFAGDRFVLDVFGLLSPSLPRDDFLSLGHFIGAPRMMRAYNRGSWRVLCASADDVMRRRQRQFSSTSARPPGWTMKMLIKGIGTVS